MLPRSTVLEISYKMEGSKITFFFLPHFFSVFDARTSLKFQFLLTNSQQVNNYAGRVGKPSLLRKVRCRNINIVTAPSRDLKVSIDRGDYVLPRDTKRSCCCVA